MNKLVSIIIPTYKRSETLDLAIDSLLNQVYQNIEIIIVDDNNPNTEWRRVTEALMEKYKDNPNIHYYKHDKNRNGSAARNTGFEYSNGDYICFLDDDDLYYPEKIMNQVEVMNSDSTIDACCCNYRKNGISFILEEKDNYIADILLLELTPQTSGIMFKRSVVSRLHGFDITYNRHQDYEFLLRFFSNNYRLVLINKVLYDRVRAWNSNIPKGKTMEAIKEKFLTQFDYLIIAIDKNEKGFKNKVLVTNYISVIKSYIKEKDFKSTYRLLKKCFGISCVDSFTCLIKIIFKSVKYKYLRRFLVV